MELVTNRLIDLGADFIHGRVNAGSEEEEGTREQNIRRFHEDDLSWVLVAKGRLVVGRCELGVEGCPYTSIHDKPLRFY